MIQVSISEIKNKLSHYLRLVRGGEEVEIMDRRKPVARLVHISDGDKERGEARWIEEMVALGVVRAPAKKGFGDRFLNR